MKSALLTVCSLSILMIGCDDMMWGDRSDRFTENFSYSYDLKPGGRLSVENMNGSVEITGWDRDTVEITGVKYAATEDLLRSMRIDVQSSADSVRIRTIPPGARRGNLGARYTIKVPRKTELERVVSSNGQCSDPGHRRDSENSHVKRGCPREQHERRLGSRDIERLHRCQ